MAIAPSFLHPSRNYINPLSPTKLLKNTTSTTARVRKNPKWRNLTSPTISAILLIIPILLTMCGITARWRTGGRKFWPGYLHSNPRYGTTTSKAVGSTRWETGSSRPRNIGIGSVASVGVVLRVRPCFATEVLELAKHSLGEREDTRGNEGIADML